MDGSRTAKSEDNRSRHSSISSSTSLVFRESTDSQILEQIHTFNLKRSSVYSSHSMCKDSDFSSLTTNNKRSSSTSTQRAFYVSELVKIQDIEMEKTMEGLDEILKLITDFRRVRDIPTQQRLEYLQQRLGEKKRLKISFSEIEEIQNKVNVRNSLGLK